MKFFTAILSTLALAVSTTSATPIDARLAPILSLTVTEPKKNDFWLARSEHLVEWDTFGLPSRVLNQNGVIFLGVTEGVSVSQQTPLAEGFSMANGNQTVTVPYVPSGTTYVVILKTSNADAAGTSSEFTIISGRLLR